MSENRGKDRGRRPVFARGAAEGTIYILTARTANMTIFRWLLRRLRVFVPRYRKMQPLEDAGGQNPPFQMADWREDRSARGRHSSPATASRDLIVTYVKDAMQTANTIERVAPAAESEMPQPVKSAT